MDLLIIENEAWRVGLVPENGGCVAFGQARVETGWVDVLRPTPADRLGMRWDTASFPLMPWSNRIRSGILTWNGRTHTLRRWRTDDFAMHGSAVEYPWRVNAAELGRAEIEFDSRGYVGVNWPWDFVARAEFALNGPRFTWRLSLENVDHESFPAGLGHHPYFVRALTAGDGTPLGDEALLRVNCEREYALTNGMAEGGPGPIPDVSDFRGLRPLGPDLVNVCQTARTRREAATIDYPGILTLDIEADDLFSHVVTYIPPGERFFAVEPVTNTNDGFTLHAAGIPGTGVFTIKPGETVEAEFSLALR